MSRSWVMTTIVVPAVMQLFEQRQDRLPGRGVEVASGFVGKHDRRAPDECARDRHSLALPAGELGRPGGESGRQAQPASSASIASSPAFALRHPCVQQPVSDVVQDGRVFGEEELLEHEADPAATKPRQFPIAQQRDVHAGDAHRATRRAIQRADQMQQRRLARTRRADDADKFACADAEADTVECGHRRFARIDLADVFELEDECHDAGTTTRAPACTAGTGDLHETVGVVEQTERDADKLVGAIGCDDLDGIAAASQREQCRDRHHERIGHARGSDRDQHGSLVERAGRGRVGRGDVDLDRRRTRLPLTAAT